MKGNFIHIGSAKDSHIIAIGQCNIMTLSPCTPIWLMSYGQLHLRLVSVARLESGRMFEESGNHQTIHVGRLEYAHNSLFLQRFLHWLGNNQQVSMGQVTQDFRSSHSLEFKFSALYLALSPGTPVPRKAPLPSLDPSLALCQAYLGGKGLIEQALGREIGQSPRSGPRLLGARYPEPYREDHLSHIKGNLF